MSEQLDREDLLALQLHYERHYAATLALQLCELKRDRLLADLRQRYGLAATDEIVLACGEIRRAPTQGEP